MNNTVKIYFSSFIKSFSSTQLKTVHPFLKIINIIEKKNTPPIIDCITAILKIPHSQPYLHNKDNVPEPGKIIFPISLANDAPSKDEYSSKVSFPHLYIISNAFNGCLIAFIDSIILFLLIPDVIKDIKVPKNPINKKVIFIGNTVIIF